MADSDALDRLRAAISINQHLLLALYDVIGDQDSVISQFSSVTEQTSTHTLYSENSDVFFDEFEHQRSTLLLLLVDARAT